MGQILIKISGGCEVWRMEEWALDSPIYKLFLYGSVYLCLSTRSLISFSCLACMYAVWSLYSSSTFQRKSIFKSCSLIIIILYFLSCCNWSLQANRPVWHVTFWSVRAEAYEATVKLHKFLNSLALFSRRLCSCRSADIQPYSLTCWSWKWRELHVLFDLLKLMWTLCRSAYIILYSLTCWY